MPSDNAEQDFKSFAYDVVFLVAELSYNGPCLPLELELKARNQALREFWDRWVAHSWVGYPTADRLAELEFLVRERRWMSRFDTVDSAVSHLRKRIRKRCKPIDDLELLPELVAATDDEQAEDVLEFLEAIDEPARNYVAERLNGETWEKAAVNLGHDQATMRRHRDKVRKEFQELRSYRPANPKRVRERIKRR